jgi:hypothetical protein
MKGEVFHFYCSEMTFAMMQEKNRHTSHPRSRTVADNDSLFTIMPK